MLVFLSLPFSFSPSPPSPSSPLLPLLPLLPFSLSPFIPLCISVSPSLPYHSLTLCPFPPLHTLLSIAKQLRQGIEWSLAEEEWSVRGRHENRGILNTSNNCFANAVFQCLVHCPQLYTFFSSIDPSLLSEKESAVSKQVANVFSQFVPIVQTSTNGDGEGEAKESKWSVSDNSSLSTSGMSNTPPSTVVLSKSAKRRLRKKTRNGVSGGGGGNTPVKASPVKNTSQQQQQQQRVSSVSSTPSRVMNLSPIPSALFMAALREFEKGLGLFQQQDSQEFLNFLLEKLHSELKKECERASISETDMQRRSGERYNGSGPHGTNAAQDDGWEEVGWKNRMQVVRSECESLIDVSPITASLFNGTLRTMFRRQGAKDSVSMQPFYSLPLDISSSSVYSVEEALDATLSPSEVTGYKGKVASVEVQANQSMCVHTCPEVLVLLLNRFAFDDYGRSHKVEKHISFGTQLTLRKNHISPSTYFVDGDVSYSLRSLIVHHGSQTSGGHYTAYTCTTTSDGQTHWFHHDDTRVQHVAQKTVLDQSAYLLFYQRDRQ